MNQTAWADQAKSVLLAYAVPFAGKLLGVIALWIIGRLVIGAIQRMADRALAHRQLDVTLARYVRSVIGVTLTVLLVLAMLSVFGVETASFAGIIAAAGIAIGMAWSGLLSNFAAGVFMVVLRPFRVGDMITAAGVTGVVKEVGLFATSIDTGDNIRCFVGNGKIFGDTILNYDTNAYRRVDLRAQLAHSVDPMAAALALKVAIMKIPYVLKEPPPAVELLEFTAMGPVLAVRPFCRNEHYWQVYFATNDAIQAVGVEAGYPAPEQRHLVRKSA